MSWRRCGRSSRELNGGVNNVLEKTDLTLKSANGVQEKSNDVLAKVDGVLGSARGFIENADSLVQSCDGASNAIEDISAANAGLRRRITPSNRR